MKRTTIRTVILLAVVVGVAWGLNYYFSLTMTFRPRGEIKHESLSPQGTYTVRLYETNDHTVGELVINKTGKRRNIYIEYHRFLSEDLYEFGIKRASALNWEDDDTVLIYGIRLNLPNDTYNYVRDRMANLPQGEYVSESTSPKGTYTIKLYSTNPTLSSGGMRGELITNKNGKEKNIYWDNNKEISSAGKSGDEITWEDESAVIINGIRLGLPNKTYNWSRDNLLNTRLAAPRRLLPMNGLIVNALQSLDFNYYRCRFGLLM